MARIAGVNIPQNKLVRVGLTYIYGIGQKIQMKFVNHLKFQIQRELMNLQMMKF